MIKSAFLGLVLAGSAPVLEVHSAVLDPEFSGYNKKTFNIPARQNSNVVDNYCSKVNSVVCLSNTSAYKNPKSSTNWINQSNRTMLPSHNVAACDVDSRQFSLKPAWSLKKSRSAQFSSIVKVTSPERYLGLSKVFPAFGKWLNRSCNFAQKDHQSNSNLLAANPIVSSQAEIVPQQKLLRKFPYISRSSLIVQFPQENSSFVPSATKLANPAPATKRISSNFGWRRRPFSNRLQFHQGIDYGAPLGSPVVAVGSGIVTKVVSGCADFGSLFCGGQLGNWIEIDHGNGRVGTYGHLRKGSILVREGTKVSKNQPIAQVGSSGWSTGAHLDFRFKVNGKHEDPARYVMTVEPTRLIR